MGKHHQKKMFGNKENRDREREEREKEQRERDERIKRLCEEQARLRAIEKEQEARLRELERVRARMEADLRRRQEEVDRYRRRQSKGVEMNHQTKRAFHDKTEDTRYEDLEDIEPGKTDQGCQVCVLK